MSLATLGLALWLVQSAAAPGSNPAAPAGRPKAPPGLSWEDADQIADTVARLERRLKAGKPASREPITVTERQVNSYVTLALGSRLPPSVTGLSLRFEPQRLAASGTLDLDAVRSKLPQGGASSLLAFLSGTVPVVLKGRLQAAQGEGKLELEEATVGGISLPASLLSQMVAQATRSAKQPEGVDILAPFPLPWTARSVRLETGRAVVEFAQQPAR
jgi:hypothetical protein